MALNWGLVLKPLRLASRSPTPGDVQSDLASCSSADVVGWVWGFRWEAGHRTGALMGGYGRFLSESVVVGAGLWSRAGTDEASFGGPCNTDPTT